MCPRARRAGSQGNDSSDGAAGTDRRRGFRLPEHRSSACRAGHRGRLVPGLRCGRPRRRRRGCGAASTSSSQRPGGAARRRSPRPSTMSPGRGDSSTGRHREVHQPAVAGAARQPPGGPSLRPSPTATSTSTVDRRARLFSAQAMSSRTSMSRSYRSCTTAFGTWSVHGGRRRAGPLGVLEREGAGEARRADDVQCGLEVGLGLAGEAHDDVGGDRRVRHRRADLVDDAEVPLRAVGAAHRPQHARRSPTAAACAAVADVRRLGHRRDHVVGEVLRVRAGEPDPLQPRRSSPQERSSLPNAYRSPNSTPYELTFCPSRVTSSTPSATSARPRPGCRPAGGPSPGRAAPGRCRTCRCCCSRPRSTPSRRRSTRAGSAASTGTPRATRGSRPRPPSLCAGPLQQHRQRADVVGAEDHVDPRRPADDLAPVLLRQAAADGDLHARVGVLDRAQMPEVAVEPVVGVLPHRAGVEHDDVGAGSPAPART